MAKSNFKCMCGGVLHYVYSGMGAEMIAYVCPKCKALYDVSYSPAPSRSHPGDRITDPARIKYLDPDFLVKDILK